MKRNSKGQFIKGNKGGPGRPKLEDEFKDLHFIATFDEAEPTTEVEIRERFRILNEVMGLFDVIKSQEPYPDFILRAKNGKVIRAEVEIRSNHFKLHNHDPSKCDLIICWAHNWSNCPVPVISIAHLWYAYKQMNQLKLFCYAYELGDILT